MQYIVKVTQIEDPEEGKAYGKSEDIYVQIIGEGKLDLRAIISTVNSLSKEK